MSYNRDLETDRVAKRSYDARMKELAAERLGRNKAWNQTHKSK